MATTKIRTSSQVQVDANLDLLNNKIVNLANGTNAQDAVTKTQLDTAVSGIGGSIHVPVADLTALKALTDYADKMLINTESLGLYRYDAESTATSNDTTVIRPTNIASDASPGRWIRMSATINEHNLLSAIQGGTTGEYYHLTSAEHTNATRVATSTLTGLLSSTDWSTFNNKQNALGFTPENTANKGAASGYASLNASSKVVQDPANAQTTSAAGKIPIADGNGKLDSWISGNRAGKSEASGEVPTGDINGSNTAFTLANTPVSGSEKLFRNGIRLQAGAGNDYTISGATITMLSAPVSGEKLTVDYWY